MKNGIVFFLIFVSNRV